LPEVPVESVDEDPLELEVIPAVELPRFDDPPVDELDVPEVAPKKPVLEKPLLAKPLLPNPLNAVVFPVEDDELFELEELVEEGPMTMPVLDEEEEEAAVRPPRVALEELDEEEIELLEDEEDEAVEVANVELDALD
jgi:hypothetical protein